MDSLGIYGSDTGTDTDVSPQNPSRTPKNADRIPHTQDDDYSLE